MRHGVIQPDGRLYIDNSILTEEAKCEAAASIRYGLGLEALEGNRIKMDAGTAMHAAMDVHFGGGKPIEAVFALERRYEELKIAEAISAAGNEREQKPLLPYRLDNLRVILTEYLHRNQTLPFDVDTGTIEQGAVALLDPEEQIWFSMTTDVGKVTMRGSGGIWFVDTKTTGRYLDSRFKRSFMTSTQVTGYTWGMRQATGLPYLGGFINAINIKDVPNSTRACSEHGVKYAECGRLHVQAELFPVTRTAEAIEKWKVNAIRLARRYKARLARVQSIRDVPMVATDGPWISGGQCADCQAFEWCVTGQQPGLVGSVFQSVGPWDPQAVRAPKQVIGV